MSSSNAVIEEDDKLLALQRQLSVLVRESDAQRAEISRLRRQLEQQAREQAKEREYVAAALERIAQSGTWRWGHRLATLRWRIARRPVRDRDAVTRLLERLATPQLLGPDETDPGAGRDGQPAANGASSPQDSDQG